jgi:hypothetical protein
VRRLGPLVLLLAVLLAAMPAAGEAQPVEGAAAGVIEGTVRIGTQGERLSDDVMVMFIRLQGGEVRGSDEAAVEDGRYRFEAEASPDVTYVPRAVYEGVQYLGEPVRLTPDAPSARRDFTVYATSRQAPELRIEETIVTVVALDRAAGEVILVREDVVRSGSDRVYIGDDAGTTLRIPAPEGVVEADGVNPDGEFAFEGGVVSSTVPLRPGSTSVITRYRVAYDLAEDRYRLRVTAPVDADRLTLRVPERFVRSLRPAVPARMAAAEEIEGERLLVVERRGVRAGQGLLADLDGLAGIKPASNPLTEPVGAAGGAALALAVLAGTAVFAARLRSRRARA